ncbi:DUF2695 domain-containing protein [Microbacterium sp. MPKO10]|uniref:DUF2695 domain-containing protein n=1 Tax=Microbacterium sp. MPKO10 TaxID=2989818 RepID=UPI003555F222
MTTTPVTEAENYVAHAAEEITTPHSGECLICYVQRMLEMGCTGLRWATRYRDLCAPRATRLEATLGRRGGFCDCEILMNAVECTLYDDPSTPEVISLPECRGVQRGSTQPCSLWRWS